MTCDDVQALLNTAGGECSPREPNTAEKVRTPQFRLMVYCSMVISDVLCRVTEFSFMNGR
jgi:hypothetical protein